ncbi:hypothetical protein SAMN02990966_03863 [Rhodospirillales bacterium URHD0017]|nr:hypothetical protein SAMN02990966_03863 [Rhodospirillales bacterium URHD0017]
MALFRDGAAQARQSPGFGNLELVLLADIHLHEEYDDERADILEARMAADRLQRHPVILGRTGERSLVHLDGATRIQVLRRLGCRHVAAQIVDYRDEAAISLLTWSHLTCLDESTLLRLAQAFPACSLERMNGHEAAAGLAQRRLAAAVTFFASGNVLGLACGLPIGGRIGLLNALVQSYAMPPQREIVAANGHGGAPGSPCDRHPQANAMISFPSLSKEDVLEVALGGTTLFPPGITRHVINCGRILHVNAPFTLLRSSRPLEEKARQFEAMLAGRHQRIYQEATIQFEN